MRSRERLASMSPSRRCPPGSPDRMVRASSGPPRFPPFGEPDAVPKRVRGAVGGALLGGIDPREAQAILRVAELMGIELAGEL